ncbi:hypothetical protein WN944_004201 [Citrus x changshan-huyou]|uniref:Uncharacterized protein n=1 Tax=Citrus x changshan-huyou TaxID=2935761 RepID=A0AAP0M4M2_9ROSI
MKFNFHRCSCMRSNLHTNYVHKLTFREVMFRVKIKKSMESMRIETVFNSFHSYHAISVCMDELLQIASMYGICTHTHTHTHSHYICIMFPLHFPCCFAF